MNIKVREWDPSKEKWPVDVPEDKWDSVRYTGDREFHHFFNGLGKYREDPPLEIEENFHGPGETWYYRPKPGATETWERLRTWARNHHNDRIPELIQLLQDNPGYWIEFSW